MLCKSKKFRHELKYIISTQEYHELKNKLKFAIQLDENSKGNEGYSIRSLYFDDVYNSAYLEKKAGIEERKKYRIRIYNGGDGIINFEKKSKRGQYIHKTSEKISKKNFYQILDQQYDFLRSSESKLLREISLEATCHLLRPVIIVDYEREAYIYELGNVRITFDKNLRAGLNSFDVFNENMVTQFVFSKSVMIMEIKYDAFMPAFISDLIQSSNHYFTAASKYVMCRRLINNLKMY